MNLPDTVSEAEFVRITSTVAKALYRKYGAIHGTEEDFNQEVVVWALLAMPKYDPARPLDAFIYTVAKTRALNAIRDKVTRSDAPCRRCHEGTPCGADGSYCKKYLAWAERNRRKANLARPLGLFEVSDSGDSPVRTGATAEAIAEGRELNDLIDRHLPVSLRADYLRLLAGEAVPKPRREKVQQAVRDILDGRHEPAPASPVFDEADDDLFDPDDEDE